MTSPHESSGIYVAETPISITIDDELATRPQWERRVNVRDGVEITSYLCEPSPCIRIQVWWTDAGWRYWVTGGYGPLTGSQRGMLQRALAAHGLPKGGG